MSAGQWPRLALGAIVLLAGLIGARIAIGGSGATQRLIDETPIPAQSMESTLAERVSLAISSAIVLALVGAIVYLALAGGDRPADIDVTPRFDRMRRQAGQFYLPFEVVNHGDRTAENVRVRVSLGSAQPEESEVEIQFLPGGATEEGIVVFDTDPTSADLRWDLLDFLEP